MVCDVMDRMPAWEVADWEYLFREEAKESEGRASRAGDETVLDEGQKQLDTMLRAGEMSREDYEDACARLREKRAVWESAKT